MEKSRASELAQYFLIAGLFAELAKMSPDPSGYLFRLKAWLHRAVDAEPLEIEGLGEEQIAKLRTDAKVEIDRVIDALKLG